MTETTETDDDTPLRRYAGWFGHVLSFLCFGIAVVHIYVAIDPVMSELERNAFHFASFGALAALTYPAARSLRDTRWAIIFDVVLAVAVPASAIWLAQAENAIYDRGVKFALPDWIAAIICVIGAIELSRRVAGVVIPILIILALTYVAFWGSWISGIFAFPGLSVETVAFRSVFGDDAMFGTIARISSSLVFLFILFGAFLIRSGAGDFVVNLARAIAGRLVGGPGIVAVIASGLTGTISGSAVANTASTGVITIPLMKRAGFAPKFAGGVEAAASTGGQLMPPIMGAGAFVMASFTQIPYETIVAVAALPALLYFLSVAFFVRIEARRENLPPMPAEGETLGSAFRKNGASFVIPIGTLITLLVVGYTPTYAAVFGMLAVIASSWLTQTKMGPRAIYEALVMGTKSMVLTAVLLCSVGLVVNVIATAGVGNTFSLMIASWAGGNILIAILLIAIASLVLGMGLPVTAAYIVLATLSAPALAGMIADQVVIAELASGALSDGAKAILLLGAPEKAALLTGEITAAQAADLVGSLPLEVAAPLRDLVVPTELATAALLSAHMIIFWLSQDSNVTPPVALAAFAAAAIAKAPAMATGVASWKLAKGLYIIPVLFAYTPLLSGDWPAMIRVFLFAVIGVYALAAALQGCMEHRFGLIMRTISGVAGIACLWPGSIWINLAGVVAVLAVLAWNIKSNERTANAMVSSQEA